MKMKTKKIKLDIEETLKYHRSVFIEVPEDIPEGALYAVLDDAEKTSSSGQDVSYVLEKTKWLKVLERSDNDYRSPFSVEVEISEMSEMRDDK